ncbi:O-antigen ligase family protein [Frondihabitans australicus]|uniref:O-antigen ligase family protein n=1 Tax=Frondihabitans australicus TaxID=386892 RepID=UPI0011C36523|nr:O-antigen ligase family protein [Frondihabitans australicus]
MSTPGDQRDPLRRYLSAWIGFSAGGQFSQVLAVAILLYALGIHTVRALVDWPGSIGILATLVALAALSLFGARHRIEWHGILPLSLIALFGYTTASVFWSQYTWVSIGGVMYALSFAFLGMYLALGRDLVQVIRATGDALRILLTVSFSLEIFSGLLIDQPITFLGIQGNLAAGGPIQGVGGTRNFLGFLAALGLVTFAVEWFTRSITQGIAIASGIVALLCLVFASSPVTSIAVLVLVVAAIALRALRRAPAERKPILQGVLLALCIVGGGLAWFTRDRLLVAIGATGDLRVRLELWTTIRLFITQHPITGWGFTGPWQTNVFPFSEITVDGRPSETGLGAFFDTWFQIGVIGLLILLAAGALAFFRSWLTASDHPIVAYVWPALVLLLIAVTASAESYLLAESNLMLFVAIATISARKRSWRLRLPHFDRPTSDLPTAG